MTLGELYQKVNFLVNRDQLGTPASPEMFNLMLKDYSIQLFDDSYRELEKMAAEQGSLAMEAFLQSFSPLKKHYKEREYYFTEPQPPLVLYVPDDYARSLTLSVLSGSWRKADIIGPIEYQRRTQTIFIKNPEEYPFAQEVTKVFYDVDLGGIEKTFFKVVPIGNRKFKLSYFSFPAVPVFDYCISENDELIYMPVGSKVYVKQGNPEASLFDANGVMLTDNVTLRNSSLEYPYTSQSVELDWLPEHHDYFVEAISKDSSLRARENLNPNEAQP